MLPWFFFMFIIFYDFMMRMLHTNPKFIKNVKKTCFAVRMEWVKQADSIETKDCWMLNSEVKGGEGAGTGQLGEPVRRLSH